MDDKAYRNRVGSCVQELDRHVDTLAKRHEILIVISALAQHVGTALFLAQESGVMTEERARAVIERIKRLVFGEPPGQPLAAGGEDGHT